MRPHSHPLFLRLEQTPASRSNFHSPATIPSPPPVSFSTDRRSQPRAWRNFLDSPHAVRFPEADVIEPHHNVRKTFGREGERKKTVADGAIGAVNGTCTEPTIEQHPLIITESDVRRVFKRVNTRKVAGPDGICGRVLKACADQLALVFTNIFNVSLMLGIVPSSFKRSTIIPVPKKPSPSGLNDSRPIALTLVMMK
ncbi:hypothetical protein P4O66_002866 [Electrophorus voltai]|uniref:Reverse transcriptase domain-containing protein n=1 Tax=Electrophorus voltai TaxID=2609070 RepID=A0AAD8YWZ7_9TELE|nr:hypothetical protein P4O66_002866 [Electrophorus voltai]